MWCQCLKLFEKAETRWSRAACLRYTGLSPPSSSTTSQSPSSSSLWHVDRLHKEVIYPGLSENLDKPEEMMAMFESQAEKIKTVYTKYLTDHLKVKKILRKNSMEISRFPILWRPTQCTSIGLQSMQTWRFVSTAFSTSRTCIWLATISTLKHSSRCPTKMKQQFIGKKYLIAIKKSSLAITNNLINSSAISLINRTGKCMLEPERLAWRWTTGWFWARWRGSPVKWTFSSRC